MVDFTAVYLLVITRAPSPSVAIIGTTTEKQTRRAGVNSVPWIINYYNYFYRIEDLLFLGNLMMFCCYSFVFVARVVMGYMYKLKKKQREREPSQSCSRHRKAYWSRGAIVIWLRSVRSMWSCRYPAGIFFYFAPLVVLFLSLCVKSRFSLPFLYILSLLHVRKPLAAYTPSPSVG